MKKTNVKLKNKEFILVATYGIFLAISFGFINYSLKQDTMVFQQKEEPKPATDKKEVKIYVVAVGPNDKKLYQETIPKEAGLFSTNTVEDLLELLRKTNRIKYTKVAYAWGEEIGSVNNITPAEGFAWRVYENDVDITGQLGEVRLKSTGKYAIRYVIHTPTQQ